MWQWWHTSTCATSVRRCTLRVLPCNAATTTTSTIGTASRGGITSRTREKNSCRGSSGFLYRGGFLRTFISSLFWFARHVLILVRNRKLPQAKLCLLGSGLLARPFLSKETLSTQSVEAKVTRNDGVVSLILALAFRIKDKFVMVGSETVRNYAQARVC